MKAELLLEKIAERIDASARETREYVDASVKASAQETREYVDASVKASAQETREYVDASVKASAQETREYVDTSVKASAQETREYVDTSVSPRPGPSSAAAAWAAPFRASGRCGDGRTAEGAWRASGGRASSELGAQAAVLGGASA
jgi:hypothetical protein